MKRDVTDEGWLWELQAKSRAYAERNPGGVRKTPAITDEVDRRIQNLVDHTAAVHWALEALKEKYGS